ncbi:oxygen-independent coproporphyrinogen III oxidase [Chthonobacter rhizosphaerae]|uniref:oxygen-independent coproporphyrinogen III oxidase n=1 Tax=Chthonobacter rhizosphaerae TaxID=2735553 RepID=UPI0015EF7373|nr:oxygen-independent coproporphyrinogen III oxidase [Chthonobacter rhizosphaerae]
MNAPVISSVSLSELARRTVPRYTSYPTAPHFSTRVDAGVHAAWLMRAGRRADAVSLYLHVPFCRSICHYCGCTTKASLKDGPILAYAETLRREIALVAELTGPVEVSHIHWGGGTPNLLPPAAFEAIVEDLHRRFRIRDDVEHAIELDPRHVTRMDARRLMAAGVTRASLGVQDLDPGVQAAIGRIQPLEVVEAALAALRIAGIHDVNFDLMYGLPGQTRETIRHTAMNAAGLAPSRIALFGYAHVPWFKPNQSLIDEASLPDADARIELARVARETIDAFGYEPIGIDHFARPDDPLTAARDAGTLRRNFQGYTTDAAATLIGFGASSIGRTPEGFAQNAPDTAGWRRAIEAGQLATVRGKAFEGEDLMRGEVIEALLSVFTVDLSAAAARHGADPATFSEGLDRLAPLVEAGWVAVDGWTVRIERQPTEIARLVASAFDAYLGTGGRHSVAV